MVAESTDLITRQANNLIESIYRMEVDEQRVLLLAIKKVNDLELRKEHFGTDTQISITAADYGTAYDMNPKLAFKAIMRARDGIYDRSVIIPFVDSDGKSTTISARWIDAKGVVNQKSEISFFFSSKVIPFIYLIVREEFTLLDLKEVGKLKSKYAVRLYSLLMKWRNAKYAPYFSIDDLRDKLGVEPDEYPKTGDFNIRVVNVAIDQINKGTGFSGLRAAATKQGRTITGYRFYFDSYDNQAINVTPLAKITKKDAAPERFEVYQMTDSQILTFSRRIKDLIMETGSQFAYLGNMMDQGKGEADLLEKITNDFIEGNFEPYYEVLQHLEFSPNKTNRTKVIRQQKPAPVAEEEKPVPEQPPEKPAPDKKPAEFPEDLYQLYQKKNGKLSREELIEGAAASNREVSQYIGKLLVK